MAIQYSIIVRDTKMNAIETAIIQDKELRRDIDAIEGEELRGVAAGEVEEHQVGGRVVEERRQRACRPEVLPRLGDAEFAASNAQDVERRDHRRACQVCGGTSPD